MGEQTPDQAVLADLTRRLCAGEEVDIESLIVSHPTLSEKIRERWQAVSTAAEPTSPLALTEEHDCFNKGFAGDNCLSPGEIREYLYSPNKIEEERLTLLEVHISVCEVCRTEVADQREFLAIAAECDDKYVPERPQINIPGYSIENWIARGAFGDVWLARHDGLNQTRAVKIISLGNLDLEKMEQFNREATIMASLGKHPHRVMIYDRFLFAGELVLVMEYVPGGPLSRITSPRAPLAWQNACRYVAQAAEGLLDLHERGILHRDIKPSNLLLDDASDRVLLADFGLAQLESQIVTQSGTAGYAAPELLRGEVGCASDVFSLAATLFHLITGRPAFDESDLVASLRQANAGLERPVPSLAGLPVSLVDLTLRGLSPDPEERPSLSHFLARIRQAPLMVLAEQLQQHQAISSVHIVVDVYRASDTQQKFQFGGQFRAGALPSEPATVRTGESNMVIAETNELLRLDVTADKEGYISLLSLNASGSMTVIHPQKTSMVSSLPVGRTCRTFVKLQPPSGVDWIIVAWTHDRPSANVEQWQDRLQCSFDGSLTMRDLELVSTSQTSSMDDITAICVIGVKHDDIHSSSIDRSMVALDDKQRAHKYIPKSQTSNADESVAESRLPTRAGIQGSCSRTATASGKVSRLRLFGNISCEIYTRASAGEGEETSVQLTLFPEHGDYDAKEVFRDSGQFDARHLPAPAVRKGENISFRLQSTQFHVGESTVSLAWDNCEESICFRTIVPKSSLIKRLVGVLSVYVTDAHYPVGQLIIRQHWTQHRRDVSYNIQPVEFEWERFTNLYPAFAWEDRDKVLARILDLPNHGTSLNLGILDQKPEHRWRQFLFRQIGHCNALLLFWSPNAARSPWVREEVRYALRCYAARPHRGQSVLPVILENAPLWEDLAGIDFDSGTMICNPA